MSSAEQNGQHYGEQLRILHWNIHSWRDSSSTSNLEAIADLISGIDPHVVSLVEVDEPWGQPDSSVNWRTALGTRGYLCQASSSVAIRQSAALATRSLPSCQLLQSSSGNFCGLPGFTTAPNHPSLDRWCSPSLDPCLCRFGLAVPICLAVTLKPEQTP